MFYKTITNPIQMIRIKSASRLFPLNFPFQLVILVISLAALFSCKTTKNSYYFQNLQRDTTIKTAAAASIESKIKKNDQLSIVISSLNPQEDAVYNAAALSLGTSLTGTGASVGYQVDAKGEIQLHRIGNVKAEGMTRKELKSKLESSLSPYLKDPVVTVRYLNHRVTILGEVAKPQVVSMPEERMSLLEVLGASGDVTPFARRDNILVIRETEAGKQFKRLNLENQSIFTSDWYYLKPDDVVYVEPNDKKVNEEKRNRTQQAISIGLSALSVAIIILDRIIK